MSGSTSWSQRRRLKHSLRCERRNSWNARAELTAVRSSSTRASSERCLPDGSDGSASAADAGVGSIGRYARSRPGKWRRDGG
uniref:Uncharacterized protein n=1 Tax=Arundo donax TaxID=35708 RepID=A0A0A9HS81_ARUDO